MAKIRVKKNSVKKIWEKILCRIVMNCTICTNVIKNRFCQYLANKNLHNLNDLNSTK